MGRENMKITVDNRPLETFKMKMRMLYGILIWYEFVLWPDHLNMSRKALGGTQIAIDLAPFWAMAIVYIIIEVTEAACGQGRILSQFPAWYLMGVHTALYSQF